MPKLMVVRIIMCLGAIFLSTAPISQTFAQVKQQVAQASGIAVEDTLDSSGSAVKPDSLQLLRPGATAIFPVADSADSLTAMPTPAALSTGDTFVLVTLIAVVLIALMAIYVGDPFERR